MNVQKFKQEVMKWENYQEKFNQFRIWAENSYISFYRKIDLADKYMSDECDCNINLNEICILYSKLGLKISEDYADKLLLGTYDGFGYYADDFCNLFKMVKNIEDDLEFCYGLLLLISKIDENQKINYEYVLNIKHGLAEYDLEKCLEMIVVPKKVFVAMWFDEEMKVARAKIENAIVVCGYKPILIDAKEHNNQIVPEIFKEINDSVFIVADLTGQRGGVYYEVGYATAKGKQVILSCKEEEKTHFDVAQINTIYWKDEDDLYKRLVNRIKATIGINN